MRDSIGTVLGFIISYRTTSSFERYNEGRRLWSQIIYANRTFARTIWFHVPSMSRTSPLAYSSAYSFRQTRRLLKSELA